MVERLEALLDGDQVQAGQVETNLEPGWQWVATTEALIAEGKRIKGAIEAAQGQKEAN